MWKIGTPVIARRKPEYDDRYVRASVTMRVQEDGCRGVVVGMNSASFCMLHGGLRSWWKVDELHFDGVGFLERIAAMVPEGAKMTGSIKWRLGEDLEGIEIKIGDSDEKKAGES